MFQESLREVVDRTEGGIAGLVMGFDGIAVESYATADSELNVENIGMEYSVVLTQIKQAAEMLQLGQTNEVTVHAENMTTVIRLLTDEYFVAIAIEPTGNLGKARYLLRIQAPQIIDGLS